MAHLPIRLIVVHCTASPTTTTLEQVEEWHKARGFTRVGYHRLIQAGGIVRHGRSDDEVGAHAKGRNTGSLGVSVCGDPRGGHPFDADQERQLLLVCADLCRAHGLDPMTQLVGHCELDPHAKPDCPGFDMHGLRAEVAARLAQT